MRLLQVAVFPVPVYRVSSEHLSAHSESNLPPVAPHFSTCCMTCALCLCVVLLPSAAFTPNHLPLCSEAAVMSLCCFVQCCHPAIFPCLQEKEASLPPEPSGNTEQPTVSCLFRMPDGTRASRRFLQTQPASLLFDFADARGAGGLPFGGYHLVMQFPRRVVDLATVQNKSVARAGLVSPQEVLLLERTVPNESGIS